MSAQFRQAALEKLSSPERLDSLMQVTTTKGWIALIGLFGVIGGAAVWGIYGSAPDNISGFGILLRQGGIFDVEASGSGIIQELLVAPGSTVQVGDVLARFSLPEIEQQLQQTRRQIVELEQNRVRETTLINQNRDLELQSIQEEKKRLQQEDTALKEQEQYLVKRLEAQRKAVELGLITGDQAEATAQQLSAVRATVVGNESQIVQLEANEAATRNAAQREVFALAQRIEESKRQLANLQLRHDQQSTTRSPYAGRVIGLLVDAGQIVERATPMVTVELDGRDIEAIIFVPLQGSRIRKGMQVQLSPEGIAWEEHGYMLGAVKSVSDAPASPDTMNRLLRNETLVRQFSAGGSAYMVTVTPAFDASTPSGFRWSSRQGPDTQIGPGTLLTALITIDQQRPVALVIPALRRWIGF